MHDFLTNSLPEIARNQIYITYIMHIIHCGNYENVDPLTKQLLQFLRAGTSAIGTIPYSSIINRHPLRPIKMLLRPNKLLLRAERK